MILQALGQFYERMAAESGVPVAPGGFEYRRIPFVIVLDRQGSVVRMEDTRSGTGDDRYGKLFLVPKGAKKTNGVAPNLFWDNASYLLGHPKPGSPKHARRLAELGKERQRAFIDRIRTRFPDPVRDEGIQAILLFLERRDYRQIFGWEKWREVEENSYNLSFRLDGDDCLVCERPAVTAGLSDTPEESSQGRGVTTCLMTGSEVTPVRTHSVIRGVRGTVKGCGNIVSFGRDAFCSFGLTQGENAPVGKSGEFAYTTAANLLLGMPRHRFPIADATAVFWGERPSVLEELFADLFTDQEDPGPFKSALGRLADLVKDGSEAGDLERSSFFLLALAPNAARIAIRLWYRGTVAETAQNVLRHFKDCQIVHPEKQPESLSLYRLLVCTAFQGKPEYVESQLACELMNSILSGGNYPQTLLISALRRCRAEGAVTPPRAALIKAILVRQAVGGDPRREIGVVLDVKNRETGYLLGRLFSLIERAQKAAIPGIRSTISDKYFGLASCKPQFIFPQLLKFKKSFEERLRKSQSPTLLEQLTDEILRVLPDLPAVLTLQGQALFALGYYHQMHALSFMKF